MNQREYERAVRDTRKAIYKGDPLGIIGGVVRALVARNDADAPEPLQLPAAPKQLAQGKRKAKRTTDARG
jgi:hypothetical protein